MLLVSSVQLLNFMATMILYSIFLRDRIRFSIFNLWYNVLNFFIFHYKAANINEDVHENDSNEDDSQEEVDPAQANVSIAEPTQTVGSDVDAVVQPENSTFGKLLLSI